MTLKGRPWSLKMAPFKRLGTISYPRSIATMVYGRIISRS